MARRIHRDLKPIIDAAIARGGWKLEEPGRTGHCKLRHTSGHYAVVLSTPSTKDAPKKLDCCIRRIERANS